MTYDINSSYEGMVTHQNGMTDNSVTYIKVDYVTGGIDVTIHNIEEGGGMIWVF